MKGALPKDDTLRGVQLQKKVRVYNEAVPKPAVFKISDILLLFSTDPFSCAVLLVIKKS